LLALGARASGLDAHPLPVLLLLSELVNFLFLFVVPVLLFLGNFGSQEVLQ
jgi:hypothetical protein